MATLAIAAIIHVASGCWAPTSSVTVQAPRLHKATALVLMEAEGALAASDMQGSRSVG